MTNKARETLVDWLASRLHTHDDMPVSRHVARVVVGHLLDEYEGVAALRMALGPQVFTVHEREPDDGEWVCLVDDDPDWAPPGQVVRFRAYGDWETRDGSSWSVKHTHRYIRIPQGKVGT